MHHWRLFGYAGFDVMATLLAGYLIAMRHPKAKQSYFVFIYLWFKWTYVLVLWSIAIHWLYGVNTLLAW